jgi:hypothetical protein
MSYMRRTEPLSPKQSQLNILRGFGETLKWSLILKKKKNQNPPKKLTKTHTKLPRKIKHTNKHYTKKKESKTHKNTQEKTHTQICFFMG